MTRRPLAVLVMLPLGMLAAGPTAEAQPAGKVTRVASPGPTR